jgi:hypothetical protein
LEVPVEVAHPQELDPHGAARGGLIDWIGRPGGGSNAEEGDERGSDERGDTGGQVTMVHAGT